jgi:FMNH2-dependent dimethyl sulfone monooxygenase
MDQQTIDEARAATNPLFNDTKLKLGTFSTNLSGGCTISTADGMLEMNWPNTTALSTMADEMAFEALVPVGRWKGFGGETNFNGEGFECYTWAAAMSVQNKNSAIFATSHVPTVHPCMAAKQGMTIDHISGGRFTLNVVTGWFAPEIEMFGAPLFEHDDRYDMAIEWLDIIKKLWTYDEEFNYDGKYYTVKNAICGPLPIQKPHPVVMSAGASPRGREFAAKYADVAFTNLEEHNLEYMKGRVEQYKKYAREEFGRDIKVWMNAYIFQADSEKDAQDYWDYCVLEKGDYVAADNLIDTMGINSLSIPEPILKTLKEHFMAGWGGFPIIGTKEQVVDALQLIADAGFDGTLLSWPKYIEGMKEFQEVTYPLVKQAGLR